MAVLISDKVEFKAKPIPRDKGTFHSDDVSQEDVTVLNVCVHLRREPPEAPPGFGDTLAGGFDMTQHTVILRGQIYFSEKLPSRMSQATGIWGETGVSFWGHLPWESPRTHFVPSATGCDTTCEMLSTKEAR